MGQQTTSEPRELRRALTPAESALWARLRARQLSGRKWRRQQPIDHYVVDFFCPELRLVVEVDGDVHASQEERDTCRQAYLESQGLRVVRFTNEEVLKDLEGVLTVLWGLSEG